MKEHHKPAHIKLHTNSREHQAKPKSHSKSHERNKHLSDSKLLLKPKHHEAYLATKPTFVHRHSKKQSHNQLRDAQQTTSMNEYYNQIQGRSKSKRKLAGNEQQVSRSNFLNSIYMHREDKGSLTVMLGTNDKVASGYDLLRQEDDQPAISNNLLLKIKSLEKAGGFDFNGKYIIGQSKKIINYKNNESQHQTISLYEEDKKKDKKKQKSKKQDFKTRLKKQEKSGLANNKIPNVKSIDKMYLRKEPRSVNSPILLPKNQKISENELAAEHENQQKANIKQSIILSNKTSKTFFSQQTQSTPQAISLPEPSVRIQDVIKQMKEDNKKTLNYSKLKLIYTNCWLQRIKSIELICKISANMGLRRQSHSLAIHYIDRYMLSIEKDVTPKQLKLIALTALLLATKIDDGIMSRKLCHQYINHMSSILSLSKTPTKNKSLQKGKQSVGLTSKQTSVGSFGAKGNPIVSELGLPKQQLKNNNKQEYVMKQMSIIHSLQLDMLVKFEFKMIKKSSTYWIDTLTALWDNYICEEDVQEASILLFRNIQDKRNISHCYQIVELLSLDIESYRYSSNALVLSSMYLIIRMRLEQHKQSVSDAEIYAKYISDLTKSTNLIFYDKVGINELFGDFLVQVEMNISDIIDCIQFVGRNLIPSFKTFLFQSKSRVVSGKYDFQLSIYEENCQLYKVRGSSS